MFRKFGCPCWEAKQKHLIDDVEKSTIRLILGEYDFRQPGETRYSTSTLWPSDDRFYVDFLNKVHKTWFRSYQLTPSFITSHTRSTVEVELSYLFHLICFLWFDEMNRAYCRFRDYLRIKPFFLYKLISRNGVVSSLKFPKQMKRLSFKLFPLVFSVR